MSRPRHPGGGLQLCRPLANLQAHAAAHEIRMRAALSQVEDTKVNIESKTLCHQARGPSSSPISSPEKRMSLAEASIGQSAAGASTVQTTSASKPDGASS